MGKNKKEIPLWAQTGHAKPITRRDFLSAGLIPFAASMVVPNWMSLLLGSPAHAQTAMNCPTPESLIPFITLNLAGGAAMASNYVPMNVGREPISTYDRLGLGNNQVPLEREFGNVPFAGMNNGVLISKMLAGIRQHATATTLANTAFVAIPCVSQNDTNLNRFDISGAVTKAGLIGATLPNIGRVNTATGLNQAAAIVAPPTPLVVGTYNTIVSSVGYTSFIGNSNQAQKNSLTQLMSNLNALQTRRLLSKPGSEAIKQTVDCAGIKNIDVVAKGTSTIDPLQNASFSQVWGITTTTGAGTREMVFGSMIYNSLIGQAGTCNLEIGGYDYHNNSRATGDAQDLEAGIVIGRALQSAATLQKPVFIYVVSDGSVYSPVSQDRAAVWVGDRGSNGVAYMLYYNPNGRPATSDYQIGHFTDNQAADTSFITGGNPELVGVTVFANWCQANKRMDLFEKVAGKMLDSTNLAKVVKIA